MRKRGCLEIIGERESIAVVTTGEDVWRGSASTLPIPDQTNGEQMTIVSTSVNDDSAGTGIRTIELHYLDGSWNEQTEALIMDGTTPVNTVATDIKFVQDIHASSVGSGGVAAGVITFYQTGDSAIIYDMIDIGGNMSLTMSKMVPASFNFHLDRWSASVAGNKPTFVRLRSTDHGGVLYNGGDPVFIFKDTVVLETAPFTREWPREERIVIPSKSVIKASVWTAQAGGDVAVSVVGELLGIS